MQTDLWVPSGHGKGKRRAGWSCASPEARAPPAVPPDQAPSWQQEGAWCDLLIRGARLHPRACPGRAGRRRVSRQPAALVRKHLTPAAPAHLAGWPAGGHAEAAGPRDPPAGVLGGCPSSSTPGAGPFSYAPPAPLRGPFPGLWAGPWSHTRLRRLVSAWSPLTATRPSGLRTVSCTSPSPGNFAVGLPCPHPRQSPFLPPRTVL